MLLSLLLTFASLGESEQAQARAHVTNTADKVGCQVWLAKMYAVEFVRRSTGPRGRYRKTYAMIDAMLAKQKPVELVIPKEWAKLEPGTYPYTLDEALTLAKAIRGVPSDQIGDILTKLEAGRGKVADLGLRPAMPKDRLQEQFERTKAMAKSLEEANRKLEAQLLESERLLESSRKKAP